MIAKGKDGSVYHFECCSLPEITQMTLVPKQREIDDQVQILPSLFQSWSTSDMRCVVAEFLNIDCYHKLQR